MVIENYPVVVLFQQSNFCFIWSLTEISFSGTPFTFYLLSFGKLIVNQLTSCCQKLTKGAIKGSLYNFII